MVRFIVIQALLMFLLGPAHAQQPAGCRDCSVGDCLAVPKAEGGCDACICNGLLMPDCVATNCSAECALQPSPDGCLACVCPDAAPNVCPPIPACPSRCQIKLGSGCPRCTCPDEAANQCPAVTCLPTCTQVIGPDGCAACECPPEEKVCPEMPACPLGCIDLANDPPNTGCLSCNCTIIEELLAENQLIPTGPETPPENNFAVELVTDSIDPGLVEVTEPLAPNPTPNAETFPTPTVPNPTPNAETVPTPFASPNSTPNAETFPTPFAPNPTPNAETFPTPFAPNPTPNAETFSTPTVPNPTPNAETVPTPFAPPNSTPNAETFPTRFAPNPTPNADTSQTTGGSTATVPEDSTTTQDLSATNPTAPQTPALPNPFLNNNSDRNTVAPNIPIAPRIGPNRRLPPGRPINQIRPAINIPCGETSCPPGCSLCIQNNGCGRCLCGDSARICPAVPPCQAACITSGRDGCFTCACPAPGVPFQGFNPLLGPSPFAPGIGFGSEEIFLQPSVGAGRPPFVQFVRGPSRGQHPVHRGRPGQRRTSPGRVAVQSIPPNLLGQSRFQIFS